MIEHDFDEDFVPDRGGSSSDCRICRHPGIFADRVISRIDRLQPAQGVAPVIASRHLELQQGGQAGGRRRRRRTRAGNSQAVVGGRPPRCRRIHVLRDRCPHRDSERRPRGHTLSLSQPSGPNSARLVLGSDTIPSSGRCTRGSPSLSDTRVGLFGGYTAIRHAAQIAKRKAA